MPLIHPNSFYDTVPPNVSNMSIEEVRELSALLFNSAKKAIDTQFALTQFALNEAENARNELNAFRSGIEQLRPLMKHLGASPEHMNTMFGEPK